MRKKNKILICQIFASIFMLIFLCEYCIYHIALLQCSWPELTEKFLDESVSVDLSKKRENEKPVKAFFIADLHLLGFKSGRRFDRLRGEWQMYKSFQTAIHLFEPEVIFLLGDLFEGASKCDDPEFYYFVKRLKLLFQVKENMTVYLVAGNTDIGLHYDVRERLYNRFVKVLKTPPVQLISIRGNHFVLINSMAMEGDGCFLCRPAQVELILIAKKLRCAKGIGSKCPASRSLSQYSRPILLQHFPMYRESDKNCFELNDASEEEKMLDFHEGRNCLSKETSEMLYDLLSPRLIIGGHTHQGCHVVHRKDIHEYTVPSFNWRYRNSPSFLMGVFLPSNYSISKCYVPQESVVTFIYFTGFGIILIFIIISLYPGAIHYEFLRKRIRRELIAKDDGGRGEGTLVGERLVPLAKGRGFVSKDGKWEDTWEGWKEKFLNEQNV